MGITVERLTLSRSKEITLDIPFLEFDHRPTLLLGVNGAGKTTLFSVLGGHLKPYNGSVRTRGKIAIVEQHFRPIVGFNCAEYCAYVAWLRGQSWKQAQRDAASWLNFVDLQPQEQQRCEKLSGGQRARLAIATALNSGADTLVLDEPSASLDPISKQTITSLYSRIVNQGQSLIVSTHDSAELQPPFSRVVVLHAGRIHFDGDRAAFHQLAFDTGNSPAHVLARAFRARGGEEADV
ncbi:MAG: ABC transporter ATP-binding protein [Corynebacterium sp.]|uniref:ATP-binding cassette domain-containing protein n=1 Tax=Corynebacterium sp. TaxID=1720 RepID=UPI0026DA83B0|nr:ABC transporter ATP-binding protein [Corynebacterium sp.]MDO4761946.1 ABC transporter ATP-binding protein [Corynebacterium sp.]